jgi:hypothetical protein
MRRPFLAAAICGFVSAAAANGQAWIAGPSLPTGGAARKMGAAVRVGGDIYLLGGTPFTGGDGAAHRLSSSGTWTSEIAVEGTIHHLGAAVDGLGRIVVFGGVDPSGGDPGEDAVWTPLDGFDGNIDQRPEQAPARIFATAVDATGRVYTIGGGPGAAPTAGDPNVARADRYDPVADAWSTIAPLPAPRSDAAAAFDGAGGVVVVGGYDAAGAPSADCFRFDVSTGVWSAASVPPLPAPRAGLRLARGADGRLYAVGGTDGSTRATTFVFDPATGAWSTGPAMTTPRRHFGLALDAAGFLWAMGGDNDTGGTNAVEKLPTPTCAQFAAAPAVVDAYLGQTFGLAAGVVGGTAPFSYQWRKDGVPLADGPSAGGGTVAGATSADLAVAGAGTADAGAYDCVVGNACGFATKPPVAVALHAPAATPAWFSTISLHPAGALSSGAAAVEGSHVVGNAQYSHPQWGALSHAMHWPAPTSPAVDLTPSNSVGGGARALKNGLVAGWWWWPYQVYYAGQWLTGYYAHGCVWTGYGAAHVDVQSSGWEIGYVNDTDGTHHVGTQTFDESSTNGHAFRWSQNNGGPTQMTPPSAWGSGATAIDGDHEFGSVHWGFGVVHAVRWTAGAPGSYVDLHPAGASSSGISGAGSGQQVGGATIGGVAQAGLWTGSAASFVPLNPPGAASASLSDCLGGLQVGTFAVGGFGHAGVWSGTAASAVDLHVYLPPYYTSSTAAGLWIDADGRPTIVGSAYNATAARNEAVVWLPGAASLSPAVAQVSAVVGGVAHLTLSAGPALAGRLFVLGGSMSGTSPGLPLTSSLVLPLNFDAYTAWVLSAPDVFFAPSIGVLDADGRAEIYGAVPAGLGLTAPLAAHHACVVLTHDLSGFAAVTNASLLTIAP